ncbi:MAG: TM2 domain-containing protein [Bacteroidales bacterium]
MDQSRIDTFLLCTGKYFPEEKLPYLRDQLMNIDDSRWSHVQLMQFQNPTTLLLVSIFVGSLGIDRFMIGDTGLGIGKLLTCGGLGIWQIVDWFLIMDATREKNMQKILKIIV